MSDSNDYKMDSYHVACLFDCDTYSIAIIRNRFQYYLYMVWYTRLNMFIIALFPTDGKVKGYVNYYYYHTYI